MGSGDGDRLSGGISLTPQSGSRSLPPASRGAQKSSRGSKDERSSANPQRPAHHTRGGPPTTRAGK
eukprot:986977-Prymnesium_polylepis.1